MIANTVKVRALVAGSCGRSRPAKVTWEPAGRRRFGHVLTGHPHSAEDLAQTALGRSLQAAWRLHRIDDPHAFVRKVMVKSYAAWCRRQDLRERTRPVSYAITTACTRSLSRVSPGSGRHALSRPPRGRTDSRRSPHGTGQAAGDPERQIDLLCASQAMTATVLAAIPNGYSRTAATRHLGDLDEAERSRRVTLNSGPRENA